MSIAPGVNRAVTVRVTLLALALLATSCSDGASETTSKGASQTPKQGNTRTVEAEVVDTAFKPLELTVDAGTTVKWTQTGRQPHSVTAADDAYDSNPTCSPLRSDECLGEGDVFTHTFEEPGTYLYYCRVHGLPDGTGMVARIIVK